MVLEKTETKPAGKELGSSFNVFAYAFFTLTGILLLIFSKDWMMAVGNLGIALVFDPFNQKIKWTDRPLYQRIWLLVHVSVVFILFICGLFFVK